ncbi:hypothetical protein D6825_03375 [Candidatus Woesearchaeota archaeon]|nr:MAG: hypothetical protein D6825_03375 [Candidatus Woesearchaeota archaeon]
MNQKTLRNAIIAKSDNIGTHLGLIDTLLALDKCTKKQDILLISENAAQAWRLISQRGEICATGDVLSVAAGCALAIRDGNAICLVGDGELQYGSVWECALFANARRLPIIAIVNRNGIQLDGQTENIMPLEPLEAKWRAFGWSVMECDGHSQRDIIESIEEARQKNGPVAIITHTIPGKDIPFIENSEKWHKKLTDAQKEIARAYINNG